MGERLEAFGSTPESEAIIAQSIAENVWFTREDILRAVEAIRREMLHGEKLGTWLENYPTVAQPKRVAVIMAGNIPLVGFFDLLCVVARGHECHIKPSSKDRVLMRYVVELLQEIDPTVAIYDYSPTERYDMAIASGGDDANRYFSEHFAGTRTLLRGSRHSVAVLDGTESDDELRGLVTDITAYSGLGCRSVSMLFVPRNTTPSIPYCSPINPKIKGGLRSIGALLRLQNVSYDDHGAFITVRGNDFPVKLGVVAISEYDNIDDIRRWLDDNAHRIQCVVSHADIESAVPFGHAQYPRLWDYADGIDTMRWLEE